jgi:hypothetical protein
MNRYFAFLLLCLALCASCENKKAAQAYLDEVSQLYQERFDDTQALVALLSEGLSAYPDNIPLLESRTHLYCSRGMLPECRADVLRLLDQTSGRAEVRMMLCMLDEYEGGDWETYEACYREAAAQFAARFPAATPEQKTADKFNHIVSLLMARDPNAEKEKAAFLSGTKSHPNSEIYEMLNSFDRKQMLHDIFGEESPTRTESHEEAAP